MNTNDKTLADVQPGGRVRLGDQAERARFEKWMTDVAKIIAGSSDPYPAGLERDYWRVWQAALSAQLSTGGQDAHEMADALERIAAGSLSDYEGVDADELHILRCAKLIRDLAARQPVESEENVAADTYWTLAEMIEPHVQRDGINPDGALPASVHDSVAILLAHWLRTRQPVDEVSVKKEDANNCCLILRALGMEEEGDPVAEVQTLIEARDRQSAGEPVRVSGDMVDGELSVASAIDQVVELFPSADRAALRTLAACFTHHSIYRYATPPAQAVDLGKLPRAVELLSNVSRTLVDWAAEEQREAIGIVKALIDSQAVGK
ncbi:hypothetical protein [Stenotrophomonas pavanii]|uniref:hypothetical protein n=1 Tax=Stenotrophomonas pavanii TaxID=487698 RepID=UPI0039C69257